MKIKLEQKELQRLVSVFKLLYEERERILKEKREKMVVKIETLLKDTNKLQAWSEELVELAKNDPEAINITKFANIKMILIKDLFTAARAYKPLSDALKEARVYVIKRLKKMKRSKKVNPIMFPIKIYAMEHWEEWGWLNGPGIKHTQKLDGCTTDCFDDDPFDSLFDDPFEYDERFKKCGRMMNK